MTNNGGNKTGDFGSVVYDSGKTSSDGKKRIGVSATEVEFLNDIPPSIQTRIPTSGNGVSDQARVSDIQKQSNNYHTLSSNRIQPKANVVYQDGNDQNLNSAVDRLLEKYAPDATPKNLVNTTANRQPFTQVNTTAARDEPSVFTFQTNAPSSSKPSSNYSTVIRPNTGQVPQAQTLKKNDNKQSSTRPRPVSAYDSFQHTVPQSQQQQQQHQSSIPIKTKNGLVTNVVPGKLYALDDDPLHLLFDKQNIDPHSNSQQASRQQTSFVSTFQPSNSAQISQDPLAVLYTDASQRYPPQQQQTTTNTNSTTLQPFDLQNLISRVQQEYAREIQPFVSSIKFIEKDREYGQSLADIGFTTPVTVRKGFSRQADDILRRSFGQNAQRKAANRNDHSDGDRNQPRSSNRPDPLSKIDSKQSFTSVTSTSTYDSESDDRNSIPINKPNRVNVHDQATSPPPKPKQINTEPLGSRNPVTSAAMPLKPMITNETDDEGEEEETTTIGTHPVITKLARRITSDQMSSSESETYNDQEEYPATYNDLDHAKNPPPKPSESVNAMIANVPVTQPVDTKTRERINATNLGQQRSEDIHPTPPTIRPSTNTQTVARKSESEKSYEGDSGSEAVSDSDEEAKSSAPINQIPPSTTNRSNAPQTNARAAVAQNPPQTNARESAAQNPPQTNARSAVAQNPPQTNARAAVAQNPPPTNARESAAQNPSQTNARSAVAQNPPQTNARESTAQNPPQANARAAVAQNPPQANARQAAGTATNPNIPFIPPDQRAATHDRGPPTASSSQPGATGGAAHTGSTRLFQSDGNQKEKRSIKDAPAAFGNKIKSLFHRK